MQSKEVLMQLNEAKKLSKPLRELAKTLKHHQFGTFLKRGNSLASSATPQDMEDNSEDN